MKRPRKNDAAFTSYTLEQIPRDLWLAAKTKALMEGKPMKDVLLRALQTYVEADHAR